MGPEEGTYFVASVRSSFILALTLGNDVTLEVPRVVDLSVFCLGGLGIDRPRSWHADVEARLAMDEGDGRSVLRRLAKEPRSSRS